MLSAWLIGLWQCCRYFKHRAWNVCFYMHAPQQGYRTFVSGYTGCQKHEDPFCRIFVYSFSHDYFRNPTMLLERKREREYETDLEERWKELSTVLKISPRWTGCLSKGNVCVRVMQISPNVRRSLTKTNNTRRSQVHSIHANFYEIFMKRVRCNTQSLRAVSSKACFSSIKICYTNPMQFKRLHTIANAIWSISKNAIYLYHRVYWDCAYIQARVCW